MHQCTPVYLPLLVNCTVYYLTEPPTHFACNPFHQANPAIQLECNSYGTTVSENYETGIHWYRFRENEGEERLTRSRSERIRIWTVNTDHALVRSRLVTSEPKAAHAGIYCCQIIMH